MKSLSGMTIAILVADGFEEEELTRPRTALDEAGARTVVISPNPTIVKAWNHGNWSQEHMVDQSLEDAHASNYDALLLPGGVMNPDNLRLEPKAIQFIREIAGAGKPIASICHGPWTLINAQAVHGKTVTSWPSIWIDLQNAGAHWVDKEVVIDGTLITSRKPDDIPAFNEAMIQVFGAHRQG